MVVVVVGVINANTGPQWASALIDSIVASTTTTIATITIKKMNVAQMDEMARFSLDRTKLAIEHDNMFGHVRKK